MKVIMKIDLGEKQLKQVFKFKYPIEEGKEILKVEPGCGCTSYKVDNTHITFTITTPDEIPFQVKTDTWVKHLQPKVIFKDGDTFVFEIKYHIKNNG